MIRHLQHTSFCMGQCVSSCGSKRTFDSVPTTPDSENYPGLIPPTRSVRGINRKNSQYCSAEQTIAALVLSNKSPSRSPAAKFVSTFSQKKSATHRITPGVESPVRLASHSPPSTLPIKITALETHVDVIQHGVMKGSPVKNYFRETISSAKKSSKTVTFSEATPPNSSKSDRRKPFFFFGKSGTQKETLEKQPKSHSVGFLRRKKKPSNDPATFEPLQDKQICRITLSPKQGSKAQVRAEGNSPLAKESYEKSSVESNLVEENTNGGISGSQVRNSPLPLKSDQTMGNASSSNKTSPYDVVVTPKYFSHSNPASFLKEKSKADLHESTHRHKTNDENNVYSHSHVVTLKNEQTTDKSQSDVLRNLNCIKEENRLLRLRFFSDNETPQSQTTPTSFQSDFDQSNKNKMNRHNAGGSRSAIPLPKSVGTKPATSTSALPKLYSVPNVEPEPTSQLHPRSKPSPKGDAGLQHQPSNIHSGKWVAAAEFFDPGTNPSVSPRPQTSPATTKNTRRSSEPPRFTPTVVTNKFTRKNEAADAPLERRGTVGFQPRKFPMSQNVGIPRSIKPVSQPVASERNIASLKSGTTTSRIGIRKPEETKPFYTIGLYQNQSKPREAPKAFGVLQSGFQGVSTGIVKQRTEQYQSKVSEISKGVTSPPKDSKIPESDKTKEGQHPPRCESISPKKPGVIRSATYTIRKHNAPPSDSQKLTTSDLKQASGSGLPKPKNTVDPKYLTWTVKKGPTQQFRSIKSDLKLQEESLKHTIMEDSITSPDSSLLSGSFMDSIGYPLQHDISATSMSTSSMGTNEDFIGDPVVISDSEYLIDDEISDQPELTLTFKDSSLIHSPSSSGESLLSCDMLDLLDHNQDRIMGELTSDSAISDVSSHKPTSLSSCDKLSKFSEVPISVIHETSKIAEIRSSPSDTGSPSSVRTVRQPKSPRRAAKSGLAISTRTPRQSSGDTSTPSRFGNSKPPGSGSTNSPVAPKMRSTPDKKVLSAKPSHVRSILVNSSSSLQASQSKPSKSDLVVGLTIENVSKLHKQFELVDSEYNLVDNENSSLSVPLVEELLAEFQGVKNKLEQLQLQLETQEKREREKDELIQRLSCEVEHLKSIVGEEYVLKPQQQNGSMIPNKAICQSNANDITVIPVHKERFSNGQHFENAAVQTENNNIFNRSVTYPEEDDKYGELVSFRIGRSSSLKKF